MPNKEQLSKLQQELTNLYKAQSEALRYEDKTRIGLQIDDILRRIEELQKQ